MLRLTYSRQAVKFLKKTDKQTASRILARLEKLPKQPVPSDAKTVQGTTEAIHRIRVGDHRILYDIDHQHKTVGIIKIDKRSKAY